MFAMRQTNLENTHISALAVLLLLIGDSAVLSDDLQITATPPVLNSSLTTSPFSGSVEEPRVLRLHQPCGSEHDAYCANNGQCMYPQDSNKPSCICKPQYTGPRCMLFSAHVQSVQSLEKVIGIGFGVLMVICIVAIIIYVIIYKKCVKEALLKKSATSHSLV